MYNIMFILVGFGIIINSVIIMKKAININIDRKNKKLPIIIKKSFPIQIIIQNRITLFLEKKIVEKVSEDGTGNHSPSL